MVRNYRPDSVDPAAIERIIEAGRRAPSAGNTQGQSFVVVTDPGVRHRIASIAGEAEYVAKGFDPWISRAPVHIVICVSERLYRERYAEPDKTDDPNEPQDWPVPYWWVDAGASLMAILLAAVAEDLAAGFLGSHAMDSLSAALGIPEDVEPIGVVTIGHPDTDRRSGSLARGRRPSATVVHRERWASAPSPSSAADREDLDGS